jgi:hypothetical protein
MSIFQIYIFNGEPGVTVTTPNVGITSFNKFGISIPFMHAKKVALLTVEIVHNDVNGGLNVLCKIISNQIYNNIAGSRDIVCGTGTTNFQDFYIYNLFQNNQNINISIENVDPADENTHQDDFRYMILTFKIES